ncbi:phage tail terminator protein [Oceanobacillus sp. CF4.6]|uniref:phage tail terminator protein n=1 Tax=Oceanobacillus sp. CF4.6 TaxID=3373080 RepID=UPI003EE6BABD
MDFLDRLKEYQEGLPFTPSIIQIGLYKEDGNSVAIRPAPSNINERYMEEGKIYPFSFQMLVHNQSNVFAYDSLNQLTSQLDNLSNGAITSSDGSFNLISMQCTTTPNFVQKTSYGVLWTAIYNAELYIKGGN